MFRTTGENVGLALCGGLDTKLRTLQRHDDQETLINQSSASWPYRRRDAARPGASLSNRNEMPA